jgi:hypothetical protein
MSTKWWPCESFVGSVCNHRDCATIATLRARVAELEAERYRMRPVVDAAVKERAAADYYDETDDDAHEGDSRRRWTLAQAELSEKVASYLAATPKEKTHADDCTFMIPRDPDDEREFVCDCAATPKPKEPR